MKLTGIRPEVIAALTQTPTVKRQVRKVAAAVRTEARRRVPVASGNLKRNIAVENVYDRETRMVHFRVGFRPRAFYGGFVELGSLNEPARPFLRPAADAVQSGASNRTDES